MHNDFKLMLTAFADAQKHNTYIQFIWCINQDKFLYALYPANQLWLSGGYHVTHQDGNEEPAKNNPECPKSKIP